jgi:hypothetical protein
MRPGAARRGARLLVAVAALATLAGGCGRDPEPQVRGTAASRERSVTTVAGPTREEYIGKADTICADSDRKQDALPDLGPHPAAEDVDRFNQQSEALLRELVQALKGLEPPPADRAAVERINAAADLVLMAESRVTAATWARDDAALDQAEAEADAAWDQFLLLARQYGFVDCAKDLEVEAPARGS